VTAIAVRSYEMSRLEDKVAIVTGAGSGIGKAIAHRFAAEGALVVVSDISGEEQHTAREIGERAIAVRADVSALEDVRALIESAVTRYGRLDILVNNAGIEGHQAATADCTEENFDRVIAVNLRGVFLGMKYALPVMLRGGGGSIINVASVAGLVGFPNIPAYCASKGGVVQLTRTTALEYAREHVRVNAICPGVIWTPMVERFSGNTAEGRQQMEQMEPVGRLGTPEDVAAMAVYLASDESAFVTGTALPVDGGMVAQ
jgi:NAD(P)-dependent dehydrogenase (short-subunit alcohol dehydrogenase family)